jgi:hypothetical protein
MSGYIKSLRAWFRIRPVKPLRADPLDPFTALKSFIAVTTPAGSESVRGGFCAGSAVRRKADLPLKDP